MWEKTSSISLDPFRTKRHRLIHNSPVICLTLCDTIKLNTGEKDFLKLSLAPRGEATDGPTFQGSYGGNFWSGKLFVQLSGMGMWTLH